MRGIWLSIVILCSVLQAYAQKKQIQIRPETLNAGAYDYRKVQKCSYEIYYDKEADDQFMKMVMQDKTLRNSGLFGEDIIQDNGKTVFTREEEVYEYCPDLGYVIKTGGHGFVSAYDLNTMEEIFVNPSSYVYSPSGTYRFGTFEYDGMQYYIEIKEEGKYIPYLLFYGLKGNMTGVYWVDDETIYYLEEKENLDGSKNWIGYSTKFYEVETEN